MATNGCEVWSSQNIKYEVLYPVGRDTTSFVGHRRSAVSRRPVRLHVVTKQGKHLHT